MSEDARQLRRRLTRVGVSSLALDAAWPKWWSDEAEASPSARAELRFSLARKLGLDPSSLLEDSSAPRFVWRDEARFKHLSGEGEEERAALASFGIALASLLSAATPGASGLDDRNAASLRQSILSSNRAFVRLVDLLATCWALGVPVVHLRIFPLVQKRMAAMAIRSRSRGVVLLGRDSVYPAHLAFYLAHEIGHLALGHLTNGEAIVDFDEGDATEPGEDPEELAADEFALELLTGYRSPQVLPKQAYNARELARVALASSAELQIEPGTLALCFGYSTNDWATANAAMPHIYDDRKPVWREVNGLAARELDTEGLSDDQREYLDAVLWENDRE